MEKSQLKKFFDKILVCALALTVMICFSACGKVNAGTEIYFKVDESIMNISGAEVSVSQATTKRSFLGENVYTERNYNSFGELDTIEISVSGSVLRQGLTDTSKDYFRLLVIAPYKTSKITLKDGNLSYYNLDDVKDGYFAIDVQWLDGFSHYGTFQNGKEINCFYLLFSSQEGEIIQEYFVYVTYDLVF